MCAQFESQPGLKKKLGNKLDLNRTHLEEIIKLNHEASPNWNAKGKQKGGGLKNTLRVELKADMKKMNSD